MKPCLRLLLLAEIQSLRRKTVKSSNCRSIHKFKKKIKSHIHFLNHLCTSESRGGSVNADPNLIIWDALIKFKDFAIKNDEVFEPKYISSPASQTHFLCSFYLFLFWLVTEVPFWPLARWYLRFQQKYLRETHNFCVKNYPVAKHRHPHTKQQFLRKKWLAASPYTSKVSDFNSGCT